MRGVSAHKRLFCSLGGFLLAAVGAMAFVGATAKVPPGTGPSLPRRATSTRVNAIPVPRFRANDPLAIEAYFPKESYPPESKAQLRLESTLRAVQVRFFRVGPEWGKTVGDMQMRGVATSRPIPLGSIRAGGSARVTIGDWPSGLYFAQLTGRGTDRVRALRRPTKAPRSEQGRDRAADVDLAGLQLPRRRR